MGSKVEVFIVGDELKTEGGYAFRPVRRKDGKSFTPAELISAGVKAEFLTEDVIIFYPNEGALLRTPSGHMVSAHIVFAQVAPASEYENSLKPSPKDIDRIKSFYKRT